MTWSPSPRQDEWGSWIGIPRLEKIEIFLIFEKRIDLDGEER
jgi:hypothetical protein